MKHSLLFVKRRIPYPMERGTDVVSYTLLRALAAEFNLALLAIDEGPRSQAGARELQECGLDVALVPSGKAQEVADAVAGKLLVNARRLVLGVPREYQVDAHPSLGPALDRLTRQRQFDLAQFEYWTTARYRRFAHCPTALLNHDVAYSTARQISRYAESLRKRVVWSLEARTMRRFELRAQSGFDYNLFLSREDLAEMESAGANMACRSVIPVSFPFSPEQMAVAQQRQIDGRVLFLGSMDAPFNIDAATYFTTQVWPAVRAEVPGAQFIIAGREPTEGVRKLAVCSGVRVLGHVEDLGDLLREAAVFVSPCRIGTGIKVKVAEALAAGLPVVGTNRGLSGYELDAPLIRVDQPAEFARQVIRLLTDPGHRQVVSEAAREYYFKNLWFPEVKSRVAAFYQEVVSQLGSTSGRRAETQSPGVVATNVTHPSSTAARHPAV